MVNKSAQKPSKEVNELLAGKPQVSEKKVIKRTYYFETLLILLILSFAALATFAKQIPYFPIDLLITRIIQDISISGFDQLMRIITNMGNFEWGVPTVLLLAILFISLKKNLNAAFLILSVVGTETLSITFKALISRPRPDPELITQLGKYFYSDSFPSGHVLYYIGVYGFLLFLTFTKLKRGLLRTSLIGLFSLLLILIGMSRIYVGAHWFSDTIGAYLIGSAWLLIITHFYKQLYKKYN